MGTSNAVGRKKISCNGPPMTDAFTDPNLVGIWLLPGQPQTYQITETGDYLIGEPEEPFRFEDGGQAMHWGSRVFHRADEHGVTLVGTWIDTETGDAWDFTEDHAVTILTADGTPITGFWGLRDEGRSLWHCEKRATVSADGAHLEFQFLGGGAQRYGYSVDRDVLCLLDPEKWTELTRYINSALYLDTIAS